MKADDERAAKIEKVPRSTDEVPPRSKQVPTSSEQVPSHNEEEAMRFENNSASLQCLSE